MKQNQTSSENYKDLLNCCAECFEEFDRDKFIFCPHCDKLNYKWIPEQEEALKDWCLVLMNDVVVKRPIKELLWAKEHKKKRNFDSVFD